MAAPVIASSSSNKTGNSLDDITVTYATDGPSGIAEGDLLLAVVNVNGGGTTPDIPVPSGWTMIRDVFATTNALRVGIAVFFKEAGASETSVTFTATPDGSTSGMTAKVIRITGHDPTTPVNISSETAFATSGPYTIDGVTTTVDDCLVLFAVALAAGANRTFTFSLGTEQWDFATDPGDAVSGAVSSLVQATADATGSETATASAGLTTIAGCCIAIAPAASGGQSVSVSGRTSTSSFGSVTSVPGGTSVAVTGRTSTSSFGAVTLIPGGVVVPVSGHTSSSSYGAVTIPGEGSGARPRTLLLTGVG